MWNVTFWLRAKVPRGLRGISRSALFYINGINTQIVKNDDRYFQTTATTVSNHGEHEIIHGDHVFFFYDIEEIKSVVNVDNLVVFSWFEIAGWTRVGR